MTLHSALEFVKELQASAVRPINGRIVNLDDDTSAQDIRALAGAIRNARIKYMFLVTKPNAAFGALASAIVANPVLTAITFIIRDPTGAGHLALAEALRAGTTLEDLDCRMTDPAAVTFAEVLRVNRSLTRLSADGSIRCAGAIALANALTENVTLTELNLSENSIAAAGAASLGEALAANSTLTKLNLSENSIGAAGAASLVGALARNSALKTLSLYSNDIHDEGGSLAEALAETLSVNTVLTNLNLGENDIRRQGAIALADALAGNTTLATLELGCNDIENGVIWPLAEALKVNSGLTYLEWGGNIIGSDGAALLAEALKVNSTLTKLDVSYNEIGDEGAVSLANALCTNTALKELCLLANDDITDDGSDAIGAATTANPIALDRISRHQRFAFLTGHLRRAANPSPIARLPLDMVRRILTRYRVAQRQREWSGRSMTCQAAP
jgi:Ran GTPase-activating protein (RanGAP) involved in mRNA processing and transport